LCYRNFCILVSIPEGPCAKKTATSTYPGIKSLSKLFYVKEQKWNTGTNGNKRIKMTKGKAITLGIFSIWPFLYMILFMGSIFIIMASAFAGHPSGNEPPAIMMVILPLHLFTMFLIFALIAFYLFYLFKTDVVPQDKKALWAVVLFLGNMVSMPIFWYLYIWKNLQEENAPDQVN
jgi:hypothetical protein